MITLTDIKPLRAGVDFDLVNISLIGIDPVTGRTFDECHAEWKEMWEFVMKEVDNTSWWNLKRRWRNVKLIQILAARQGMQGF